MNHTSTESRVVPEPEALLASLDCSSWLRNALVTALGRDPVDAANDAAVLAEVLDARAASVVDRHAHANPLIGGQSK